MHPEAPPLVQGLHWLLDLSQCQCERALLADADLLHVTCVAACRDAGMVILRSVFHQFDGGGVTGMVLLAESHLSVHTWPDEGFAAVDVYVCNHEGDNTAKGATLAARMQAAFAPAHAGMREEARDSVAGFGRADAHGRA